MYTNKERHLIKMYTDRESCLALKQILKYMVTHPNMENRTLSNDANNASRLKHLKMKNKGLTNAEFDIYNPIIPFYQYYHCECYKTQNYIDKINKSDNKIKITRNSNSVSHVMPFQNDDGEMEYHLVDPNEM